MSELNLETARQIIQTTFEYGSKNNIKPLAVLVLDSGGHPLAFERQDGASAGRFAIANGKAYGASITLDHLIVDNIKFKKVPASIMSSDMGISLLGMSFLNRLKKFEFKNNNLILYY